MATLGRELKARGHRVTMLQLPALRERIKLEGLEFSPLGADRAESGELAAALDQLSRLTGIEALRFTIRCAAKLASLVLEDAPRALKASGADLALIDQNEPAGASAAEHIGLPFVSIAPLPLNREDAIPPPFVPWAYRDTVAARVRNRIGYAIADLLTAPLTSVLNKQRRKWHLPDLKTPDDSFSRLAQISTLPAAFDFPRRNLPACFQYAGPFLDAGREPVAFPWERLENKPIVYVSFGTLQNGREVPFEAVADACAGLDVQLVISAGGGQLPQCRLAGSPLVVRYSPQIELLKRCRLFVTHAGLNSVLESLHAGVPMVAIPVTNDQPAVAARVKRTGTGEVIPSNRLTPNRLRAAITRVLEDESYVRNALALQRSIQSAGGVKRAADIVELNLTDGSSARLEQPLS